MDADGVSDGSAVALCVAAGDRVADTVCARLDRGVGDTVAGADAAPLLVTSPDTRDDALTVPPSVSETRSEGETACDAPDEAVGGRALSEAPSSDGVT